MSKRTNSLLRVLNIVSWIIFIGVCIEAGGFLFKTAFTLINPGISDRVWTEVDLSGLYHYNPTYFVILTTLMIIVAVLRALMFYFIVKIFHNKTLEQSLPFSETLVRFVLRIGYFALGIGIFSFSGARFAENMTSLGVQMPGVQHLRLAGADVWLFMGVTLLVIVQIFKKGIEIQTENELTV
jgi:hypothetical protein